LLIPQPVSDYNLPRENPGSRLPIFMSYRCYLGVFLVFLGMTLPVCAAAQSDDAGSLGDLARSLRQSKEPKPPAAPNIIDNDNLSQVIDDVESLRLNGKPMLSFDSEAKQFQMSSPDGICSLSFNANATALLSSPFVAQDLPASELTKLDGPANIHGDTLEVSVYNATLWDLREITVGLTIVRPPDTDAAYGSAAKLVPAVIEDTVPVEKRSDSTLLLHLKGSAAPFATTVYRERLDGNLSPDQEWHWAIVEAKGIPPSPAPNDSKSQSLAVGTNHTVPSEPASDGSVIPPKRPN
jgi:hypothetical protein